MNTDPLHEHVTLDELGLARPPKGGTHQLISTSKVFEPTQKIYINRLRPFGFTFCFSQHKPKQDELRYAFEASVMIDDLALTDSHWQPPRWVARPLRDDSKLRTLTWLGWSKDYHERFGDYQTRLDFKQRLLERYYELNQTQTELNV